jgi:hypothetical protein
MLKVQDAGKRRNRRRGGGWGTRGTGGKGSGGRMKGGGGQHSFYRAEWSFKSSEQIARGPGSIEMERIFVYLNMLTIEPSKKGEGGGMVPST